MVDAMRSKSEMLGYGMQIYADAQWAERAMAPLRVIMERPKGDG